MKRTASGLDPDAASVTAPGLDLDAVKVATSGLRGDTSRVLARIALLLCFQAGLAMPANAATNPKSTDAPSLLDRVGALHLEKSLRARDARVRERSIERLGALGTSRALELLVRALDANGSAESPRERLLAVRALAAHVREPSVRDCLVRVMTGVSANAERADPIQALLRDTAALALAASGDARAEDALVKALRQPGRVAQAAARALVAHPPARLDWALEKRFTPSLELVSALEELGDPRGIEVFRDAIRRGSPELRARASVALARLGQNEAYTLAERFAAPNSPAVLQLAAAEIMIGAPPRSGLPQWTAKLLASLLARPETRERALELATRGVPGLGSALEAQASRVSGEELQTLVIALTRTQDASTWPALGRLLEQPPNAELMSAEVTAYALSYSESDAAERLLLRASEGKAAPVAARAAVLQATRFGLGASELKAQLVSWLASSRPPERAIAAWGLGLLEPERLPSLLRSAHDEVVQAAARAAPFVSAAELLVEPLASAASAATRNQLAIALADERARRRVPNDVLEKLVSEGNVAAPLAVFALCTRDSPSMRDRLRSFLTAPDPLLRAHAALGFGWSREPSALGVLTTSYAFEADARVRRALVHAMALRREEVRAHWLKQAAALDPDTRVRELAELALAGVRPATFAPGHGTFWVHLDTFADPKQRTGARNSGLERGAASITIAGGLALPVLADPDGIIALAGLPEGPVSLTLALAPHAGKPAEEKR
ncbi:MAG TPA: HEAT repeat domain-containing protein [Polyangiaceae bacterium]|nr:HEAT repeat domain-containing protein [Polyangiaceae bacterium]